MNVRQTIERLTGKDYFDKSITHQEKYEALINALGATACIAILDIPKSELERYYEIDKYFNNWEKYPLKYWDATGYQILRRLGRKLNITSCSESDCCCIAKSVARMIVGETLN